MSRLILVVALMVVLAGSSAQATMVTLGGNGDGGKNGSSGNPGAAFDAMIGYYVPMTHTSLVFSNQTNYGGVSWIAAQELDPALNLPSPLVAPRNNSTRTLLRFDLSSLNGLVGGTSGNVVTSVTLRLTQVTGTTTYRTTTYTGPDGDSNLKLYKVWDQTGGNPNSNWQEGTDYSSAGNTSSTANRTVWGNALTSTIGGANRSLTDYWNGAGGTNVEGGGYFGDDTLLATATSHGVSHSQVDFVFTGVDLTALIQAWATASVTNWVNGSFTQVSPTEINVASPNTGMLLVGDNLGARFYSSEASSNRGVTDGLDSYGPQLIITYETSGGGPTGLIPEPSALALVAVGMLGLVRRRK